MPHTAVDPSAPVPSDAPPAYEVRTLGCQMNAHDSERIAGLLEGAGYAPAEDAAAKADRKSVV